MATPCLPPIASGFVRKLYSILNGHHAAIIDWNDMGTAFTVFDMDLLVERVLPLYFRGRLDAFRQQLREHGFQRVASTLHGGAMATSPLSETYRHAHFLRGNPSTLNSIVRTPLPRKRTRRKKKLASAVAIKVEVKTEPAPVTDDAIVKTEPSSLVSSAFTMADVDGKKHAGNSPNPLFTDDERFEILQWLELPAVDAQPSLSSSYGSLDELDLLMADGDGDDGLVDRETAYLTDDQIDVFMRLLATPSAELDGGGVPARKTTSTSAPCSRPPLWDGGNQFSEDTLHSMIEWFSTGPTT